MRDGFLSLLLRRHNGNAEDCTCGHTEGAHLHYRSGSECVKCPDGVCSKFRRRR